MGGLASGPGAGFPSPRLCAMSAVCLVTELWTVERHVTGENGLHAHWVRPPAGAGAPNECGPKPREMTMGHGGYLGLGLALAAWLSIPSAAVAQNASALVLEKSGATTPEVQPYSEIAVGATVSLASATKLVFLHYQTCRTVTVVGGRVTFGTYAYTAKGGGKPQEVQTPCPPMVRLKGQGEVAGVVMRSIFPTVRLSVSPSFVLVGERADDFSAVAVARDGTILLEAPLSGRGFRWPASAAPLAVNANYELLLVPKAAHQGRVTVKFRTEGHADDQLTLISVD